MSKTAALIIFTIFYISGIISRAYDFIFPAAIILFFAAAYFLFFDKTNKINAKYIYIFLAAFIFGIFNTAVNLKYDDCLMPYSDSEITVRAEVLTIPSNSIKNRTKFFARVLAAEKDGMHIKTNKNKIYIAVNDDENKLSEIKIGSNIKITGRLKMPAYSQNPSQFDYSKYLQYKNTFVILYADALNGQNNAWELIQTKSGLKNRILAGLNDTRNKILNIHAKNIKSPMLEILGGVIFGDDAVTPDEFTKTSFINSGIFHILAASGMNVALIFGIWFFIAKNMGINYKISIITGMMLVLFYTFMTGFGPPVIRASLMLILILAGKLIDRETNTAALLFAAGLLMLAFNPLLTADAGFQLSFIVTFALILTAPLIEFKFKYKWINNALCACLVPVIAQIYAAPLQIYYFNTFTLYSIFANIAVIPVLSAVSFIGFISSIIALIPPAAEKVCFIADLILNPMLAYIAKTAEYFSNLPNSLITAPKPALFHIFAYYALVIILTCIIRYKLKDKKVYACLIISAVIFAAGFIKFIPDKKSEIIYFSAGNADSFLIKTADNDYFMIDTAKTGYLNSPAPAENIMLKYMKDKGINKLHGLILSHFDSDHAGGAVNILDKIKVKTFYITDVFEDTALSSDIQHYAGTHSINEEIITEDKEIYNKNGAVLTLLKPKSSLIKTENQKSLLAHYSYKGWNFLFMGDGDIYTYNAVQDKYKKNIAIIKSGHHGAKNTVNKETAANSEVFILSSGANPYNHPHPDTIKTIDENGKKYLRTDRNNAVQAVISADKLVIKQYSPKTRKFQKIMTLQH